MNRRFYQFWTVLIVLQTFIHVFYTRVAHASHADGVFMKTLPLVEILYTIILIELLGGVFFIFYSFRKKAYLTFALAIPTVYFKLRSFIFFLLLIQGHQSEILDYPPEIVSEVIIFLFYLSLVVTKLRKEFWFRLFGWFSLVIFILDYWVFGFQTGFKMVVISLSYLQTVGFFFILIQVLIEMNKLKKENDEVLDS